MLAWVGGFGMRVCKAPPPSFSSICGSGLGTRRGQLNLEGIET